MSQGNTAALASETSSCTCNGSTWQSFMDGEIERVKRCVCWLEKQRRWAEDVPAEFQLATLENYKPIAGNRVAMGAAKGFLDGMRDLVIWGGVGAGKTRLACSVLNACFAKDRAGWFVRVPLMLRKLQPSVDADLQVELGRFEDRLMREPIVCFDDLGAERDRASDYTRRTILMIAEARHDKGLRSIWTSNKSLDQLAQMNDDDRLSSRLAGWSDVVELTVVDQRLRR